MASSKKQASNQVTNLENHFLIAMPNLSDPNFHRTVTYICEHNKDGAIGIIINRPMGMQLAEVFTQMDIQVTREDVGKMNLLYGGPIQPERGFVIHRPIGQWRSSLKTSASLAVTTSQDILEAFAKGEGPKDAIIALGYAGWGPKQLEAELIENVWLSISASEEILFDVPFDQRWEAAAKEIGIDIHTLSNEIGHA